MDGADGGDETGETTPDQRHLMDSVRTALRRVSTRGASSEQADLEKQMATEILERIGETARTTEITQLSKLKAWTRRDGGIRSVGTQYVLEDGRGMRVRAIRHSDGYTASLSTKNPQPNENVQDVATWDNQALRTPLYTLKGANAEAIFDTMSALHQAQERHRQTSRAAVDRHTFHQFATEFGTTTDGAETPARRIHVRHERTRKRCARADLTSTVGLDDLPPIKSTLWDIEKRIWFGEATVEPEQLKHGEAQAFTVTDENGLTLRISRRTAPLTRRRPTKDTSTYKVRCSVNGQKVAEIDGLTGYFPRKLFEACGIVHRGQQQREMNQRLEAVQTEIAGFGG